MEVEVYMEDKRNTAMRIMEALSGVDEELLERCGYSSGATVLRRRYGRAVGSGTPVWRWAQACAAVLCLLAVGAASWSGYRMMRNIGSDGSSYSGGANQGTAGEYNNWLEHEEAQEAAGEMNGMNQPEADNGCLPETASTEGAGSDSDGVGNPSGSGMLKDEDCSPEEPDAEGGLEESGSLSADSVCLPSNVVTLSEEEARNWETLGSYIPTALPKGYVFEGASYNPDTERLAISWSRGMDSIMVSVGAADSVKTVDVAKPETYDERLYEIPYGSSVPPEYRESFQNPVFAWEDLDLEIVKSRILSHSDSGDTDTPRGNFSVLYPDGVVLRFNGRGTPEQIWEMICSVNA